MNITDFVPSLNHDPEPKAKKEKPKTPPEQLMCRNRKAGDVFVDRRGAKYFVNGQGMHIKLVDKRGNVTPYGRLAMQRGML